MCKKEVSVKVLVYFALLIERGSLVNKRPEKRKQKKKEKEKVSKLIFNKKIRRFLYLKSEGPRNLSHFLFFNFLPVFYTYYLGINVLA